MNVHRNAIPLLREAEARGWTVEETGKGRGNPGGVLITSPHREGIEPITIRLPGRGGRLDQAALRGMTRKVEQFGRTESTRPIVIDVPADGTDLAEERQERQDAKTARKMRAVADAAARERLAEAKPALEDDQTGVPTDVGSDAPLVAVPLERRVLTEKPAIAKFAPSTAGGRVYESHAALERQWSDGSVDYLCAECREYSAATLRSVASHFAGAHSRGKGERRPAQFVIDPTYLEPGSHRPYNPQARVLIALTEYLEASLSADAWADPESVAMAALTWAHERPDLPDVEGHSAAPLTSDQIVERIQRLVLGPVLTQMRDEMDALAREVESLTKQRDEALHEVDRMRSDIEQFEGLLVQIRGGGQA